MLMAYPLSLREGGVPEIASGLRLAMTFFWRKSSNAITLYIRK
jgi:hypothetical protein